MAATTLTDRAVVRLSGEDVRGFLQGLVTSDVTGALPVWAGLLTPQGKCLFDFIVWADGDDLLLDCEAEAADDLIKRLAIYRLRRPIRIERDDRRWRCIGRRTARASPIRGCRSSAAAGSALPTSRQPAGSSTACASAYRRPRRARRHALARMQCGRAERRQLHQGLLRRPGEYRADELAAEGQPPAGRGRDGEAGPAHARRTIPSSAWRSSIAASTISPARSSPTG